MGDACGGFSTPRSRVWGGDAGRHDRLQVKLVFAEESLADIARAAEIIAALGGGHSLRAAPAHRAPRRAAAPAPPPSWPRRPRGAPAARRAGHPADARDAGAMVKAMLSFVEQFLDYLSLERGLAQNSLAAYRRDLLEHCTFLRDQCGKAAATDAGEGEIIQYLDHAAPLACGDLHHLPEAHRPQAVLPLPDRRTLPHRGSHRERADAAHGENVARDVTLDEVERLLAAVDISELRGLRDRAMLEVLYATGLRVSELVNLRRGDINLRYGYVRCIGKGNKERVVPLGQAGDHWVQRYLDARDDDSRLLLSRQQGTARSPAWPSGIPSSGWRAARAF